MIKTNVDRLLELLQHGGEISVKDAALQLNTHEKQIEKLSEYLEAEGILLIDYKLAKAFLKLLPKKKEDEEDDEVHPKVFVENQQSTNTISKENQNIALLSSRLDQLISRIGSEAVQEIELDSLFNYYNGINNQARQLNVGDNFISKCGMFLELYYYKKFLFAVNKFKISLDNESKIEALRRYDKLINIVNGLKVKFNFMPDSVILDNTEKLKNELKKG